MPPEYCGGLGEKGAAALKEFVEQGGTLILFNHASDYATQVLGVKAKNVLRGVANEGFLFAGVAAECVAGYRRARSPTGCRRRSRCGANRVPAWDAQEDAGGRALSRVGVLASGWLLGEKYLAGKSALLDVPVGTGAHDPVRHAPAVSRPELSEFQAVV